MSSDSPKPLAQRFFGFCALVLGGIVAIWLALELLARIWGWVLLVAVIVAALCVGWHVYSRRGDRW